MARPVDGRPVGPSPATLAKEISGALWGIVFLAASERSRLDSFDTAFQDFIESRAPEINRILDTVGRATGLSTLLTGAFDEWRPGWQSNLADAEGVAAWFGLYAHLLEPMPVDLGDRELVSRLVRFGLDCQLVELLDAVIRAACEAPFAIPARAPEVVTAVRQAMSLAGLDPDGEFIQTYRTWRVARLAEALVPNSEATEDAKASLRSMARAIESIVPSSGLR